MERADSLKAGERRFVTILFSDMTGFTSLSERMDPEEMDALMGSVFAIYESVIAKHGGSVEKYIGDALVAVFGVPEIHEDDAARAVHAALEFLEEVHALNERNKGRGVAVTFRTGINTGLIATGTRGKFEVVTGHSMNIAQRLESETPPDSVYVSESTKEKCEDSFLFSRRLALKAKGTSQPIHAYQVLGHANLEMRDSLPFTGRKGLLDEMLRDYARGGTAGYLLTGEAGIGKTRTALALIEKARQFPDFASPVLAARAQKYRARRYSLLVDLVLEHLDLTVQSDPEPVAYLLAHKLEVPAPVAEDFASLAAGREGPAGDKALAALTAVLGAMVWPRQGGIFPPILFIDDAGHMDRESRDFLKYFLAQGQEAPFVILAAREPHRQLLEAFPGVKERRLGPLSQAEAERLADSQLPEGTDPALRETILASSGGNPLFLREYLRYARTHETASALPQTIQNIFLAALDRYSPGERELLRKLSVFLHSFSLDDAAFIGARTGGDAAAVPRTLKKFCADGVLLCEGPIYSFRLDLFKKSLYDSLLNYNKRIMHALVVELLRAQERPNRFRLVHHLIRAERYAEAVDELEADPNKSVNLESMAHIEALLARLPADDHLSRIRLLTSKAAILFNGGQLDEADAVHREVMRIAYDKRDRKLIGFAYHLLCASNILSYNFPKARFFGEKALASYEAGAKTQRANVLHHLMIAELFTKGPGAGAEALRRMRAEAGPAEAYEVESAEAERLYLSGDYARAMEACAAAMAAIPSEQASYAPERFALASSVCFQRCDWEGLEANALRAVEGELRGTITVQSYAELALARAARGDAAAAGEAFAQSDFAFSRLHNDYERIDSARTAALCRHMAGDSPRAEGLALDHLALSLRNNCSFAAMTLLSLLAEIRWREGDAERCRFYLEEASFLVGPGCCEELLPRKDLVVYYWLGAESGLLGPAARDEAARLLAEERAAIGDPALAARLAGVRCFGLMSLPPSRPE